MTEGSKLRLLVWRAGGLRCGAPIGQLCEILPRAEVAALPGAPAAVLGLANVRGALTTIVDGRTLLGEPADEAPEATILVRVGHRTVGMTVDRVEDLVTVRDAALPARSRPGPGAGWMVRVDDGPPVHLLELEGLLEPLFPG